MKHSRVQEFLQAAAMKTSAVDYAGRGEMTSDLNKDKLEKIYQKILGRAPQGSAKNYVQMVAYLAVEAEDMSAATFVNALYLLEEKNWDCAEMVEAFIANGDGTTKLAVPDNAEPLVHKDGGLPGERLDPAQRQRIAGKFLQKHHEALMPDFWAKTQAVLRLL